VAIKCPKCNADNPDTAKFCSECASPLQHSKDIGVTKTIETPFPQFSPGTSLAGRYEIIREIGKGGMGEVYLAEDTNLKRNVAIKVLPQQFALDKERLARFEREARLLASLNHPNIATIYGLEKSDDQQFLAMELVEGDTLAERIKKGPLPIEEALKLCLQIAEGLEFAHEKGIIHRDLKPANVKVTPEGKVKILDFGIAKAFQDQPDDKDAPKSPAITDEMTRPGMILGTATYMSPEQAKGKATDKRTDIWAFGCILFECLTGKRALREIQFPRLWLQSLKMSRIGQFYREIFPIKS
jgi:serine/threonine protein kinase